MLTILPWILLTPSQYILTTWTWFLMKLVLSILVSHLTSFLSNEITFPEISCFFMFPQCLRIVFYPLMLIATPFYVWYTTSPFFFTKLDYSLVRSMFIKYTMSALIDITYWINLDISSFSVGICFLNMLNGQDIPTFRNYPGSHFFIFSLSNKTGYVPMIHSHNKDQLRL